MWILGLTQHVKQLFLDLNIPGSISIRPSLNQCCVI